MRAPVVERVLNFIREPGRDEFGRLALEVFAFQYWQNPTYRRFCDGRGIGPEAIGTWEEIPLVPTAAFKFTDLTCAPPEQVFLTSGTSQGSERRGRHGFPWLEVYHTSLLTNFAAHLLPDGVRPRMLILAYPADLLHTSSLSHMLDVVRKAYGAEGSEYFIGDTGMDLSGLHRALREVEERQEPVCLLGTSFAFVQFLDACLQEGWAFKLSEGSRLMDTGGFKGRSRDISREELLRLYGEVFTIPETFCINEYGMTEMGSQFYDNTLRDRVQGRSRARFKEIPPWVRMRILDPATLEELPEGEVGLLAHYDLANCGSVMAIETEDLGYRIGEGFEIVGRASGAETRGCSLTIEELQGRR
ncbi:MAG: long-chain fatty acid--CoA ligase [candidate division NC10 bacterium]|nr:long-chain fatty acid--CoA ligase [candidate division NC10 bacterium]